MITVSIITSLHSLILSALTSKRKTSSGPLLNCPLRAKIGVYLLRILGTRDSMPERTWIVRRQPARTPITARLGTSTSPETTFGPKQGCHSTLQTASAFLGNLLLKLGTSIRSWLVPDLSGEKLSASSHAWRLEFNLLFRFHILIRHDLAVSNLLRRRKRFRAKVGVPRGTEGIVF